MGSRKNHRQAILNAAADLAREKGAAHLTLDAISERAEVSKGGLLYHFPTKESLFEAMAARLLETLEETREREYEKLPPGAARSLKARVNSMKHLWDEHRMPVAAALLAIGANSPGILRKARESHEAMIEEVESEGISPSVMRMVIFAAIGLQVTEMLGISALSERERKVFFDELLRIVEKEEELSA